MEKWDDATGLGTRGMANRSENVGVCYCLRVTLSFTMSSCIKIQCIVISVYSKQSISTQRSAAPVHFLE